MRLWHQLLIPYLSQQRLQGQHRECCCGRGNLWGTKQGVVQYVYRQHPAKLVVYHFLVMDRLRGLGVNVNTKWYDPLFRGYYCSAYVETPEFLTVLHVTIKRVLCGIPIYAEHDNEYLQWCLQLLHQRADWGKLNSDFETAVHNYAEHDLFSVMLDTGERY